MSLVQGYSSSSSYSDDGDGDKETMPKPELIDDSIKSTEFKSNSSLIKKIDAAPNLPSISNENSSTDSLPANFLLMKNSNVESEIFQKYGPQLEGDRLGKNNIFTGHVENAFQSSGAFQKGRLDFDHYGKAADPSAPLHLLPPSFHEITEKPPIDVVYDRELLAVDGNHKEFVKLSRRQLKKARRKIHTNKDHQDIENFTGPFGKYEDEITVARPSYEDKLILEEYLAKREKKASSKNYVKKEDSFTKHSANNEEKVMKINDVFYCSDFRTSLAKRNELPKRVIYRLTNKSEESAAQNQGVNALKWLPRTGHLLLSASADSNCRIFKINQSPEHFCTYSGHSKSVKDVQFNTDGTQFLSASYDRYVKLWDVETGKVMSKFTKDKFPLCLKYYPEDDNYFLVGQSDKKIICYDVRDQSVQQLYDYHNDEVRTITFFDRNRRFVSTGLDNHLRVFEWSIPVETKQIKDPSISPIICAIAKRDQTALITQCMDSVMRCFDMEQGFRFNRKKRFQGHAITGYNCNIDFSADENYLVSGDTSGSLFCWDYKTHKIERKIFIKKSTIISVACNLFHDCYIACGDSTGGISIIG